MATTGRLMATTTGRLMATTGRAGRLMATTGRLMATTGRLMATTGRLMAVAALGTLLLAACNGGLRPTLAENSPPTPQPPLELDVPPAPDGTQPLPDGSPNAPWEADVDDALIAWALDRNIAYVDRCDIATPAPGELCDIQTTRSTVRLLGPSAVESWYIVTVEQNTELTFGTGYRVATVTIIE